MSHCASSAARPSYGTNCRCSCHERRDTCELTECSISYVGPNRLRYVRSDHLICLEPVCPRSLRSLLKLGALEMPSLFCPASSFIHEALKRLPCRPHANVSELQTTFGPRMKHLHLVLASFLLTLCKISVSEVAQIPIQTAKDGHPSFDAALDEFIEATIKKLHVPGISIAIVDNGKVASKVLSCFDSYKLVLNSYMC